MAKKRSALLVPRSEASEKIHAQITKGQKMLEKTSFVVSNLQLEELQNEQKRWVSYTEELLFNQFADDYVAEDFIEAGAHFLRIVGDEPSFSDKVNGIRTDMKNYVDYLEILLERLEFFPSQPKTDTSVRLHQLFGNDEPEKKINIKSSAHLHKTDRVFIVHGHDNEAKQTAARFVEQLGLKAVIFHEQHDQGETIIEKLERVSDVGYAIVLLTPDDMGHAKASPDSAKYRARQNVVFEWGYFMAKLGRKNVIALLKGDVELLSDIQGILYTPMDDNDAWKYKIAKEMKAAGFDIDMNRI
ncbi:hypothetical protein PghCCS26_62700 [Paenibacillus glycanilyticus]|uniref:CD-NTase-associated protein 12/Pycsar effector protein TIR domain-containing protein n=1 Tax=Paenibacillus glycanilyticus TaxID=126569 RepID=A0ABQ6NYE0_9BACL|nr:nucleotide-binding protein [Paenibacillus glycanilyticus]GMK49140.1 hypothetical protein PghCCS26_62700 [Paenibacillus glycanilyticus]